MNTETHTALGLGVGAGARDSFLGHMQDGLEAESGDQPCPQHDQTPHFAWAWGRSQDSAQIFQC